MPDLADVLLLGLALDDFKPFVLTGLALGGVYALSATGIVVLYQATGVLNLAFGAVGALGALISWQLIESTSINDWLCYARVHRRRRGRDAPLRSALRPRLRRTATRS